MKVKAREEHAEREKREDPADGNNLVGPDASETWIYGTRLNGPAMYKGMGYPVVRPMIPPSAHHHDARSLGSVSTDLSIVSCPCCWSIWLEQTGRCYSRQSFWASQPLPRPPQSHWTWSSRATLPMKSSTSFRTFTSVLATVTTCFGCSGPRPTYLLLFPFAAAIWGSQRRLSTRRNFQRRKCRSP